MSQSTAVPQTLQCHHQSNLLGQHKVHGNFNSTGPSPNKHVTTLQRREASPNSTLRSLSSQPNSESTLCVSSPIHTTSPTSLQTLLSDSALREYSADSDVQMLGDLHTVQVDQRSPTAMDFSLNSDMGNTLYGNLSTPANETCLESNLSVKSVTQMPETGVTTPLSLQLINPAPDVVSIPPHWSGNIHIALLPSQALSLGGFHLSFPNMPAHQGKLFENGPLAFELHNTVDVDQMLWLAESPSCLVNGSLIPAPGNNCQSLADTLHFCQIVRLGPPLLSHTLIFLHRF